MGRKRGAKLRADEQEPDRRRCRPGRAGKNREALVTKGRRRKSGGCAVKERALTWGDLALRPKGRRGEPEREVSRGRISRRRSHVTPIVRAEFVKAHRDGVNLEEMFDQLFARDREIASAQATRGLPLPGFSRYSTRRPRRF